MQGVDLRGDLTHWLMPVPLLRQPETGWFEAEVALAPGVYRTKLHTTDAEWLLDPHNPRTCARDGVRNNLLVVGGTDEPVMHAPVGPFVFIEDDGRLCLRAGLRRGQGEALTVRWDEGHGPRLARLLPVAAEDEHLLCETHLPASAGRLGYWFVLDDGRVVGRAGTPGAALELELAALRSPVPSWWRDAVLYTVFVDRFRKGGCGGEWSAPPARPGEQAAAGGDLAGVGEALPYLRELGVTALHLTPIVLARSAHRYDAVDPRQIDPVLGGERGLHALLAQAHELGLHILLDITLTHVHRDFFAFRDVCRLGPRSPYWDWFRVLAFPIREGYDPGYDHYQKGQWQEPLLRTDHPAVQDYLTGTVEHFARLGVDGFRLDAAADVPLELTGRIRAAVRAANPAAVVFGELIADNPSRWTADALDAATDFVTEQALYDWLWRARSGARRYAEVGAIRRYFRGGPGWRALGLTATHDQPRLLTLTGRAEVARVGHLLQLAGAPIPALYYGDEIGLSSGEPGRSFEDAWPDRCRMPWQAEGWDHELLALFRGALGARQRSVALRRGDEQLLALPALGELGEGADDLLCLRRAHALETVDVLVHGGPGVRRVALPAAAHDGAEVLLRVGEAELAAQPGEVTLGPYAALWLRRTPSPAEAGRSGELLDHGAQLCAASFRQGETEALALPVHLYVTVTERCQLRCRHCLNHSPDRTRDGTARELQPWLLDRLGDALQAADYLGLTHGGESLLGPVLFELLERMAQRHRARRGRYDVHLLSNAMLLDGDTVRRLVDLGVTSLGISLDGASAATNDAIRVGGSFDTVVSNVRAAVRLRHSLGADLRVGLSTVVCDANVAELEALGRLARELGVDWLKLEELVPATASARADMLLPGDPRLRDGLAALRGLAGARQLVLVEHLAPPEGCPCQARSDPALAAFRRADDFANRAAFHPCRAAWEQACVDPDGRVHPVDYHHEPVGSLLEQDLYEIWDGAPMRRLRAAALGRIPEAMRRDCPFE